MKATVYVTSAVLSDRAGSHALTAALAKKLADAASLSAGEVLYLENGKPVFTGEGYLSVSHSGGDLFVAVSSVPVGLDAEAPRPVPARLAKRWFSPLEQEQDFFAVWTAKEAVAKIGGAGLSAVRRVEVAGESARLDGAEYSLWRGERDGVTLCLAARGPFTVVWAE